MSLSGPLHVSRNPNLKSPEAPSPVSQPNLHRIRETRTAVDETSSNSSPVGKRKGRKTNHVTARVSRSFGSQRGTRGDGLAASRSGTHWESTSATWLIPTGSNPSGPCKGRLRASSALRHRVRAEAQRTRRGYGDADDRPPGSDWEIST